MVGCVGWGLQDRDGWLCWLGSSGSRWLVVLVWVWGSRSAVRVPSIPEEPSRDEGADRVTKGLVRWGSQIYQSVPKTRSAASPMPGRMQPSASSSRSTAAV